MFSLPSMFHISLHKYVYINRITCVCLYSWRKLNYFQNIWIHICLLQTPTTVHCIEGKRRERAVRENTNWIILWSLWIWYVRKQPLNNEVYIYTNNNIRKLFVTDIYVLLHIFYNQRMNSEKKLDNQSINQY